jgi:hypothetical protein
MAEVRPGAGAVNNYWAEAFPDFTPGDGPLIDDDVLADLTYIGTTQNITAAGAINPLARYVAITGPASSTYAVTLAAPTEPGRTMVIEMTGTTSTNAVTLALTNVVGGSAATTATFNAADETLTLISKSNKWVVLDELGVTLA